jgi:alkylation response protein AidB-like acyl-CoA dehydrogenase
MDISLQEPGIRPDASSWQAFGMDASDSLDVRFDNVAVDDDAVVGQPGFYTERAGFGFGGAGVAAVWLGGSAGVLDDLMAAGRGWDDHQFAHLGAIHTAIVSADAVLRDAAELIDERPGVPDSVLVGTCRAAAERAATEVLTRAPTVLGPGPLCWDERLTKRIADLQVYVRQHHGERDLAELGRSVVRRNGAEV